LSVLAYLPPKKRQHAIAASSDMLVFVVDSIVVVLCLKRPGQPRVITRVGQPISLVVVVGWLVVGGSSYRAGTSFLTWYRAPSTRST
jgi:hypothetical protein